MKFTRKKHKYLIFNKLKTYKQKKVNKFLKQFKKHVLIVEIKKHLKIKFLSVLNIL